MKPNKHARIPTQNAQDSINRLVKIFNSGRAPELEREARRFIEKNPRHPFGHKALSASLTMQAKYSEALTVLTKAIAMVPGDSELHSNRAGALIQAGLFEDAIKSAEVAISLNQTNASAHANKALALKYLGFWQPMLESYRRAIELDPDDHQSFSNAGAALIEIDLPDQAVACFEAALAIKPGFRDAAIFLAQAKEKQKLKHQGKFELEKIVSQNNDDDLTRSHLHELLAKDCEFSKATFHETILAERLRNGNISGYAMAFALLSMESITRHDQCVGGKLHAQANYAALLQRSSAFALTTPLIAKKPLRVGYLSADFHLHATAMLMIGVLEATDQASTQIFAYSTGPNDSSNMRQRVEKACHVFRNIRALSFIDAARQITEDQIDILVDLKGYTADSRLEICALRPAPVIVSWLGYPGTLGETKLADYLIGDPTVTPLEHQIDYTERFALMPHCYQPTDNYRDIGRQPSRQECGLPAEAIVFCSFNQTYKIKAPVFKQWCRILQSVPNSVLWLMTDREAARSNLIDAAEKNGVAADRLIFTSPISPTEHLGRLKNADIALDSFPYGSHTTGSDALWAGVPLLAIRGSTFASRVSSSLLNSINLPELISDTPEAAADLAIALALNPSRLNEIKQRLAHNRTTAPFFDTQRFARNLEQLYHRIWQNHIEGKHGPVVLDVPL